MHIIKIPSMLIIGLLILYIGSSQGILLTAQHAPADREVRK